MRSLYLGMAVFLALIAQGATVQVPLQHPAKERAFDFTYRVRIMNLPTGPHTVRIWIPVASTDEHQVVKLIKVAGSVPSRVTREPEYGDRMLYAEISKPRSADAQFVLEYRVIRKEYSKGSYQTLMRYNGDPAPVTASLKRDLGPDRLIPIGGKMKLLADQVTRGKQGPVEKARAAYDYLFNTMRYDKSGTGWGRGDALWACDAKHGNCTDFHSPFIGMMRAEKVPARFAIGFPLPTNLSQGAIPGYHCWAEFYVGGVGWVPVDISEAWLDKTKHAYYFGTVDPNRVRMSLGRDITLSPRQAGPPLNYFVYPYVEVDGKPFEDVEKTFNFQDVSLPAQAASLRRTAGSR